MAFVWKACSSADDAVLEGYSIFRRRVLPVEIGHQEQALDAYTQSLVLAFFFHFLVYHEVTSLGQLLLPL